MTRILILAAALLALLWWRATAPRRPKHEDFSSSGYVEPEDGVQVDPRPAWIVLGKVEYDPEWSEFGGWAKQPPPGSTWTYTSSDRYIGTWTGWAKEIIH